MQLREYQKKLKNDIYKSWTEGDGRVLAFLPTGGGKTVVLADIISNFSDSVLIIAHRRALISQISLTLGAFKITHDIIAQLPDIAWLHGEHIKQFSHTFIQGGAKVSVASIDSLLRREAVPRDVKLWVIDEGHHVVEENKWGHEIQRLVGNPLGIGFTATPERADGVALSLYDRLVEGPSTRELIRMGYLCDYRIYAPGSSLANAELKISKATGEFTQKSLIHAAHESTITGDIASQIQRYAPNLKGLVFTTDVKTAEKTAFKLPKAAVVSAKTKTKDRYKILEKFEEGSLRTLVNVGIFDEGFDVPNIELVVQAAPTMSLVRYRQQAGRVTRLAPGKKYGVIVDLVGNVIRHGLPDSDRFWSLAGKRSGESEAPGTSVTVCESCYQPYIKYLIYCPFCGAVKIPAVRNSIKTVDGDLDLLDKEEFERLFESSKFKKYATTAWFGGDRVIVNSYNKNAKNHNESQQILRSSIARWMAALNGMSRREKNKSFYLFFGVDVLSAYSLNPRKSLELKEKIEKCLN